MKAKKSLFSSIVGIPVVFALTTVAIAAIIFFTSQSEKSQNTKGDIFKINLSTGMTSTEVLPGDSFFCSPVVTNDATKEMYVFVAVDTPSLENESIYEYIIGDDWVLVENTAERQVYAYGSSAALTTLALAESTSPMTTQMTMKNISSADYAGIDDINVMITGYAVGIAEVSDIDPSSAWLECKQKYNVQ